MSLQPPSPPAHGFIDFEMSLNPLQWVIYTAYLPACELGIQAQGLYSIAGNEMHFYFIAIIHLQQDITGNSLFPFKHQTPCESFLYVCTFLHQVLMEPEMCPKPRGSFPPGGQTRVLGW